MALDEPKEQDEVFDDRGIKYIIDKDLYTRAKPIKVDFINTAMGSGFSISSSMSFGGGGCGTSCSC